MQSSLLSSLEYSLMSYFCKERTMFPLTCLLSNPLTDINSNKFFLLFLYNNQTVTKLSPCFFSTWNAWTKHNHVISYCRFSIILPLYFRVIAARLLRYILGNPNICRPNKQLPFSRLAFVICTTIKSSVYARQFRAILWF